MIPSLLPNRASKRFSRSCFHLCAFLSFAGSLAAANYQVSPSGNDGSPGTPEAPWKTLGHAAATAVAGDVVDVRGGTYAERVTFPRSGTASSPIVFRAFQTETPIVDGTTLVPGAGSSALFLLAGRSHVSIEGFELRNYRTSTRNVVPIGILVRGAGQGVRLERNHIHHIETNYTGSSGGDAHGLAVYGDASTPISGIIIRNNHLHSLKLGSSEALVLNGNVTGFLVEANRVHDCNNIGIDLIGHEGTAPDPAQDAAREGTVRLNVVSSITSYGNPAYGQDRSAGGIYVDGGRDILIERNTVTQCDIGLECASEHAGKGTSRIIVRNNVFAQNAIGGVFLGGYDTKRGFTDACRIEHNTLWQNDTQQDGNGEIYLQFDVRDCEFRNNVIVTNGQGLVVGNPFTQNTGNTLDYNLISTPSGVTPEWEWKKQNHSGLAAWRTASAQDAHSSVANPRLLDPAAGDFGLDPKSPAIDAGDPAFVPASGETDHPGRARLIGPRTDIGACEFDLASFAFAEGMRAPTISVAGPNVLLAFTRRSDWAARSLNYTFETATGLAAGPGGWSPTTGVLLGAVTPTPPTGFEQATFQLSIPLHVSNWFIRIRVSVDS